MTQITSPHAAATAGGKQNIELREIDDENCTAWRDELQLRTRGTHMHLLTRTLGAAYAFELLLWVRGAQ